jgi:hypothetical protein
MNIHHVLRLFVGGLVLAGVSVQTTMPSTTSAISIVGIWESERCVVQERNGVRKARGVSSCFSMASGRWNSRSTPMQPALGRPSGPSSWAARPMRTPSFARVGFGASRSARTRRSS